MCTCPWGDLEAGFSSVLHSILWNPEPLWISDPALFNRPMKNRIEISIWVPFGTWHVGPLTSGKMTEVFCRFSESTLI
jgi:hypothetical protein